MNAGLFHFGDVLNYFMKQEGLTPDELSHRTKKLFGEYDGIPKSTIVHWILGEVKSPRDWASIVKVAAALKLTESEATELLKSADYPSIKELVLLGINSSAVMRAGLCPGKST